MSSLQNQFVSHWDRHWTHPKDGLWLTMAVDKTDAHRFYLLKSEVEELIAILQAKLPEIDK